ncbi:MAG: CRTAC1 family protein [Bacteroidetes bacterium]|nr:CRTAC1 family protein [Bacteroidota bacterium]
MCVLISSCGSENSNNANDDTDAETEGSEYMFKMLEELAEKMKQNDYPYGNLDQAIKLTNLEKTAPENQKVTLKLQKAMQLLLAGETTPALNEFIYLYKAFSNAQGVDDATLTMLQSTLAIAYMRLGEQENCINNNTQESCILPFTEGGFHSDTVGSASAIIEYTSLLNRHPEDLLYRWLLNVAYMTLGKYPQEVPSQWLIPEKVFESEYEIEKFTDIASILGLDVNGLSGGSIMEDFDNDGYLDIMASSWGLSDPLRYFKNNGDGTFTDRTIESNLYGIFGGLNMIHADYNNDGFQDVLVLRGAWLMELGDHPNSLLRNNGDGTFTDVTKNAGVLSFHPTQTADWGDFNNDGWLDLFIGNETTAADDHASELFVNNGDGTFTEIGAQAGVETNSFVKSAVWGDYDNDGWLDLFLSCMGKKNKLYHNNGPDANGNCTFTDVAEQAGVTNPIYSFPSWFFDYNNDVWLDIFVSDFSVERYGKSAADVAADYLGLESESDRSKLYRNNGDGTFTDVSEEAGVSRVLYSMGSNFGDIDNDGYLDFYCGTGEPDFSAIYPNRMFRNAGGKFFQDVTSSGGFGHIQKGHGVAFGDLDNDGDQDIYAVMGGAYEGDVYQNVLFENPGNENNWITLVLEGVRSNRAAIGARIRINVSENGSSRDIYNTVGTGGSFGSSSVRQEIGLGKALMINEIEVFWPVTGKKQIFMDVEVGKCYKIKEGDNRLTPLPYNKIDFPHTGGAHQHH